MRTSIVRLTMITAALAIAAAPAAVAQRGMMGGGSGAGGTGMMTIADDGTVLLMDTQGFGGGGPGSGPGGGWDGSAEREIVAIDPADGSERWRVEFTDGWPMRPATDGDLVVVALADDAWMGGGSGGDGDWPWGWGGGQMGPQHAGDGETGFGEATIVALDLATGAERWRATVEGDMAMMPVFSPDGQRIYVSVRTFDDSGFGGGPMHQGDAGGFGMMDAALAAFDRDGTLLWTYDSGASQ